MTFSFVLKALWATILEIMGWKVPEYDIHLEKCSDPAAPQQSFLFIGNSFTYYGNMPLQFLNLAKERSPSKELKVFFHAGPGLTWSQHIREKRTEEILSHSGKWDFVILQDQSEMSLHPLKRKMMSLNCQWFVQRIKKFNGKTVLLMTWCDLDKPQDQIAISKGYRELADKFGAIVIPAGELFLEVTQKDPSIQIYEEDQHHPSHYGAFLTACLVEDILLHDKAELVAIVEKRKSNSEHRADPIQQKLQDYADDFALTRNVSQ